MKSMKNISIALAAFLLIASVSPASAQFAGDLFFPVPSVQVQSGQQTGVEIQLFAGKDVFGATKFVFTYDPSQLQIDRVEPGASDAIQDSFAYKKTDGKVSFVVLNGKSAVQPSGTISLARLTVKPLVPAGSVIDANLVVDTVLKQDESKFLSPTGYGLEIVVVGEQSSQRTLATANAQSIEGPVTQSMKQRAERLRPAGSKVRLVVVKSNGQASRVTIDTQSDGPGDIESNQRQ